MFYFTRASERLVVALTVAMLAACGGSEAVAPQIPATAAQPFGTVVSLGTRLDDRSQFARGAPFGFLYARRFGNQ